MIRRSGGNFAATVGGIAAQLDNAQCRSIALPLARYETFRSMEQSKHHPEGGNRAALRPLAARPRGDWWCEDEISPVLKALRLLAYIAHSGEPVALSEITRALGLPKPTSHRLAGMLERARFAGRGAGQLRNPEIRQTHAGGMGRVCLRHPRGSDGGNPGAGSL